MESRENDYLITMHLADVNLLEKRVAAIEAKQTVMENGQELQDGAIADLGEIVGGMMEGAEA